MPTVTSSSLLMAEQPTTTSVGRVLGRASEATARFFGAATTGPSILPAEAMATTIPYSYSPTTSQLIDSSYSRLHAVKIVAMISATTTTTTTTTTITTPTLTGMLDNTGHELDLVSSSPVPTPSLYSLDELGHWSTSSNYAALIHALLASFSVILVSELGDKTFIITAIMAMKNSRSLVFISSAFALLLMTVLSVGMGVAVTVVPEVYTHYASIVLFLCFGLKMLKEAYDMSRAGNQPGESEFDEVKRSLEDTDDRDHSPPPPPLSSLGKEADAATADAEKPNSYDASGAPVGQQAGVKANDAHKSSRNWCARLRQTLHVAPIVIKVFTMVFVAEWGDRSQISTVILAAREDVFGVFIGSLSGHVFCTGLAVIGGRFVADMISVRTMTLLGGIIFLFFAAFEVLIGPEQQF